MAPTTDDGFQRHWMLAFVVGELVGFVPPAVVGAWLGTAGASDLTLVVALALAGALEGVAIGAAQAWVLVRHGSGIPPGRWIAATALGAAIAWCVGMGGGAVMGSGASPVVLVVLVPAWLAGLMAMGVLQWRVLRHTVPRSARWIPVSSTAWLVGVLIPVAAVSLVPDALPVAARILLSVLAAIAMGLVVGALTGRTMRGLVTGRRR